MYDVSRHRQMTGCEHALHESCDRCYCSCCGSPIVIVATLNEDGSNKEVKLPYDVADRFIPRS